MPSVMAGSSPSSLDVPAKHAVFHLPSKHLAPGKWEARGDQCEHVKGHWLHAVDSVLQSLVSLAEVELLADPGSHL